MKKIGSKIDLFIHPGFPCRTERNGGLCEEYDHANYTKNGHDASCLYSMV
ncbi:MAG: hypothetical protein GX846_05315 [Deltaproteobacteria bacterium]|jgi:hypothetical protein|nr:hypothetical protein [Deltaproteobacteria bacterium]